ncbi:hypothetical protein PTSG_07823 [Salpingoeca rosetta]|uniref:ABC transporter domain-containing protein n=1 Tax=Salpingoeca rosetta (strain ATCC 50818 / BSB-021) TaxID=946362 RepID=F2UGF6_SALR5|nr:uncharacterized protein PTSG_07823 [Salpingoeca rosetta]EGD75706.1 hypothetical protein PTSG_07823 [Salpingoeca rosetta]|eukprot:XP_004991627.1 hypothetical protein PTSG_07823 [Salpingoeca rosetta]
MKDVSVEIPQGKSLGLVGHTGCGKSTMIKLILKEYGIEPGEGDLTLGGINIRDTGRVRHTDRHTDTYAHVSTTLHAPPPNQVGLHEFLEMGEKDMVMLEKKAGDTSGGQQQRIGIVRALLSQPKLMVLDEITSALDGSTEAAVMHLIRQHARENNATTIIIAHRYATIEHCDEILVIEEGAVVERGTYDELKSDPHGKFYALLNTE